MSAADTFPYAGSDLARFRDLQRLAYDGAAAAAGWLAPGVTERQAAARLRRELIRAGADDFFHVPFAWFGDRTAFRNFRTPLQFFPGGRALADGMAFILGCAPVADGYPADIGYAGKLGANPVWDRIALDLRDYRELILAEARAREPLAGIYAAELISERARGRSPLRADGRASRHPPTPGLWAVEPHVALRGVGLKFEELLVVTPDEAYWLDDDLPHVRRWAAAGATA